MTVDRLIKPHFTTRRAFVAAAGFGGTGLYGLWAAYGAAPGPLALLGLDGAAGGHGATASHGEAGAHGLGHGDAQAGAGSHGAHGAALAGPDVDDFRRLTDSFIERYRLPDGTVHPRRLAMPGASDTEPHGAHAAHGAHAHGGAAGHVAATPAAADRATPMVAQTTDEPIEVPMVAGRWYYLPATLRLDAGQAYRFRMMAVDMSHGASIQFGRGARMVRLRPGREVQLDLSFHQTGRYFMYCTVYCGAAHDRMQASIEVV